MEIVFLSAIYLHPNWPLKNYGSQIYFKAKEFNSSQKNCPTTQQGNLHNHNSIQHPQNIPANPLQLVTRFCGKSSKLRRSGIGINHGKHIRPRFLWPGPLNRLPFILIQRKLPVEALDGLHGIIHRAFHRKANLVPLPAQLDRLLVQIQRDFVLYLGADMQV